jgi:hypothetical protein
VPIFKAREHIGHKDASMAISTPPSVEIVSRSLNSSLRQLKVAEKLCVAVRAHTQRRSNPTDDKINEAFKRATKVLT